MSTHRSNKKLSADGRRAAFMDRRLLLWYLGDPATRAIICTPDPMDSYELFQTVLQEELEVLWDIDIYAGQYGLTEGQRGEVTACSTEMQKYQDNFEAWKRLSSRRTSTRHNERRRTPFIE